MSTERARIEELRKFVKALYTNEQYADFRKAAVKEISELLDKIFNFVELMEKGDSKRIIKRFFGNGGNKKAMREWPGKVAATYANIKAVVEDGNLRERMAMIWNYGRNSCDLYWDTIFAYRSKDQYKWNQMKKYFDVKDLKKRIGVIEQRFGLPIDALIKLCKDTQCKKKKTLFYQTAPYPTICHSIRMPHRGPTQIVWNNMLSPGVRSRDRDLEFSRFPLRSQIVPKLSKREEKYLQSHGMKVAKGFDYKIKWNTGYSYWTMDPKHIFYQANRQYKRLNVGGPSEATDFMLDIALTFKGTNSFNNLFASVIYLGNPPDHGLSEILLATRGKKFANGILFITNDTYSIDQDPYAFFKRQVIAERKWQKSGKKWKKKAAKSKLSAIESFTGHSCESVLLATVIGFAVLLVLNGLVTVFCCCKKKNVKRIRRRGPSTM